MITKLSKQRTTLLAAISCIGLFFMIGRAYTGVPYIYYLDSFQVVGNLPVDLVDEFDDGIVDPWYIDEETVVESDGFVIFSSPGAIEGMVFNGNYFEAEMSYMSSGSAFDVENGQGDFTSTSKWVAIVPGLNQWYTHGIVYREFDITIDITLSVINCDMYIADALGLPPGLSIMFDRFNQHTGDWVVQSASVAETEITDYIILSMTFDDETDQITAKFSLDEGATFQNPFDSIDWGMETPGGYGWYIGTESWELIPMTVSIDIKPGSYPNCFNNDGHGVIPVAILTTDTFDAATVDPFSVTLDGMGVRIKGKSGNAGSLEDVDGDGDLDLMLQIEDLDAVYAKGDTVATLSGVTIDGIAIQGQDTICIVP